MLCRRRAQEIDNHFPKVGQSRARTRAPNDGCQRASTRTEPGSYAPRGGITATAGGLLFVGTSSDRKVRAYDQDTGKVLWSMDAGAAVEGVPTVYEVGGREFIVFCVGGGRGLFAGRGVGITADPAPAQYIALALPRK